MKINYVHAGVHAVAQMKRGPIDLVDIAEGTRVYQRPNLAKALTFE